MHWRNRFFAVLEIVVLVSAIIIVSATIFGIKFDPEKRVLVQTGALSIQNLEYNTEVNFNNTIYKSKKDISITLLDENTYKLDVKKNDRKDYSTNVAIKKGEVTYISPILLPNYLKSETKYENVIFSTVKNGFIFFINSESNIYYFHRAAVTKSLFTVETTDQKIDITKLFNKDKPITDFFSDENSNYAVFSNDGTRLLATFKNPFGQSINIANVASILDKYTISAITNGYLILNVDQTFYTYKIGSSNSTIPVRISEGNANQFFISSDNSLEIVMLETDKIVFTKYSLDGNQQEQKKFDNTLVKSVSKAFYFYNSFYIIDTDFNLYEITNLGPLLIQKNNKSFEIIDKNTAVFYTNESNSNIILLFKDKSYSTKVSNEIGDIFFFADLFSFTYLDKQQNVHVADIGGQDNILINGIDNSSYVVIQNSSDYYFYFELKSEIRLINIGNGN